MTEGQLRGGAAVIAVEGTELATKRSPTARVAHASSSLPSAHLRLAINRTPRRLVVASSSTCFGFKFGFEFEFKFGFESRLKFGFYKIC